MTAKDILEKAAGEIIYQTSSEGSDSPNLAAPQNKPFPLKGDLDIDSIEDIIRVFEGRKDFRGITAFLRDNAVGLYCYCVDEFCQMEQLDNVDLHQMRNFLSADVCHLYEAFNCAKDIVRYGEGMGTRRQKFFNYYLAELKDRGSLAIDFSAQGGRLQGMLKIGKTGEWKLADSEFGSQKGLIDALEKALPVIADELPKVEERPKGAKPKA